MKGPQEKYLFRIVYDIRTFKKPEYKELPKRTLKIHERFVFSSFPQDPQGIRISKNRMRQFEEADTLILMDRFGNDLARSTSRHIKTSDKPVPILVFNITRAGDHLMWNLNYSANSRSIGEPVREDFFLFTAEPQKKYLFYINGYVERGHQGNKSRLYHEHVYYIEYLGKKLVAPGTRSTGKSKVNLDLDNATVIDLRKLFY